MRQCTVFHMKTLTGLARDPPAPIKRLEVAIDLSANHVLCHSPSETK